jgi:hypothetical protein
MLNEKELFGSGSHCSTLLLFMGLDKGRCKQKKMDKRDQFLAQILNAAARVKDWEDELRRKTRDLRKLVEKFTEFDGAIFEHLL